MHGLGNDFVVLNALHEPLELSKEQRRLLADRRFGVGCDQILLIESPENEDAHVRYRIYNADGGEAEHCGNGIRCIGMYLREHDLIPDDAIRVETINGESTIYFEENDLIRVDMGVPSFHLKIFLWKHPSIAVSTLWLCPQAQLS